MEKRGSYKVKEISKSVNMEVDRLRGQVDLFWDKELKHYKEYGLKDGMSIAEFGSGPGYITGKLLEEFPNSRISAVEVDSYLVDIANDYLKGRGSDRFEVFNKSIMDTGFADDSFDFTITRLLLEHVPDVMGAVNEVYRILKSGGKAIFIDNDFEMHLNTYPHMPQLRILYEAYCECRYAEGGNPRIGRELPNILKKGGFINVDYELISAHSKIVGDEVFFKSEGLGIPAKLVQDGFMESKVLAEIAVQWRKMLKDENHAILRQLSLAFGEKI